MVTGCPIDTEETKSDPDNIDRDHVSVHGSEFDRNDLAVGVVVGCDTEVCPDSMTLT